MAHRIRLPPPPPHLFHPSSRFKLALRLNHFRKDIPLKVKLEVVIRQGGHCAECGSRLDHIDNTQFDHVPAIQLRCWDPDQKDTSPRSNDPEFIFAKHIDCHALKTNGAKGHSKRGADKTEIARTRKIAKETEDFRRRMLAKTDPDAEAPATKPSKKKWPSRPFPKRKAEKRHRPFTTRK